MQRARDRLTATFVHPRARAAGPEAVCAVRSVVAVLAVAFVGLLAIAVHRHATGVQAPAWLLAGTLAALLLAPVFTRVVGTRRAVAGYVLVVTWLYATLTVATSGGATSRAHYLYALVPLFAAAHPIPDRDHFGVAVSAT